MLQDCRLWLRHRPRLWHPRLQVLPVFREFERSMGTVLNAYVQPLVGRYVARLAGELRSRGIAAPLSIRLPALVTA